MAGQRAGKKGGNLGQGMTSADEEVWTQLEEHELSEERKRRAMSQNCEIRHNVLVR